MSTVIKIKTPHGVTPEVVNSMLTAVNTDYSLKCYKTYNKHISITTYECIPDEHTLSIVGRLNSIYSRLITPNVERVAAVAVGSIAFKLAELIKEVS